MKKRYTLVLTGLATLGLLTACGKKSETPASSSNSSSSSAISKSKSSSSSSSSDSSSSTVASSSSTPASSTPVATPDMNVDEVSQGVYTSIAGKWRNGAGSELIFDENGLVGEGSLGQYGDFSSGVFTIGVNIPNQGGFALMMIPKGSTIPDSHFYEGNDTSDSSRDRMVGTQSMLSSTMLDPYYRVTE